MLVENYTQYPAQWPETWPLAQFLYAPTGAVLKHKERENHIVHCTYSCVPHFIAKEDRSYERREGGGLRQHFLQNIVPFTFDIRIVSLWDMQLIYTT